MSNYESCTQSIVAAFMDEFGIVPENPKILVEKPNLNHLIVLINGKYYDISAIPGATFSLR